MTTQNILHLFPDEFRGIFQIVSKRQEMIQEIRLRVNRPVYVIEKGQERFLNRQGMFTDQPDKAKLLSAVELKCIMNHICRYSLYAFEEELRQGFITVQGGHRIGIAGQAVMTEQEGVRTLKYISGLNIRIAHEIKGAANRVMPYIYDNGRLQNTLVISPPGCGKTTLLRDMIRQVSDGNTYGQGISVGLVDERSEIAGCFQGCPQNDVGLRTDVQDRWVVRKNGSLYYMPHIAARGCWLRCMAQGWKIMWSVEICVFRDKAISFQDASYLAGRTGSLLWKKFIKEKMEMCGYVYFKDSRVSVYSGRMQWHGNLVQHKDAARSLAFERDDPNTGYGHE